MKCINKNTKSFSTTLAIMALVSACTIDNPTPSTDPAPHEPRTHSTNLWPSLSIAVKQDKKIEDRIVKIMSTMTLEQKIAQMIQPEIRDITVEDMRQYGFGSYLNGGGSFPENNKHASAADWIALAESFYQASVDDSLDGSNIPTMWGTDAVHGHNNVIGATLFPHNIGLGAANNPELIKKIANATAKEVLATGIDWVFAPTVAVVRDDRWGRTYEGYSEDPEITRSYAGKFVEGLQGEAGKDFLNNQQVIATVKHFLGDGGTLGGDDQGNNQDTEQHLIKNHAQGYVSGIEAGAQTVMASFSSWQGKKIHGHQYLLTDVLKTHWGFDGFVVGDWNGHGQVDNCENQSCSKAINAGLDMFMAPTSTWKPLLENTIKQVNSGEISMTRIDDAVARILRVKIRAGLFEKPSPKSRELSGNNTLIGSTAHRDIARQAVRESLVLLKNNHSLLPLNPKQQILIAGDGADNIGKQSGGWSISWQGTGNSNADFPGATSIYSGIQKAVTSAGGNTVLSVDGTFQQKPDTAIVVFGEEPYAEGNGDLDNLEYQRGNKKDLALLKRLKEQGIPVVSVFLSGRPLWVNPELNASDAFVAAWLPGSEGAGVADVLFTSASGETQYDFTGKLSYSWPQFKDQATLNRFDEAYNPLLPYGFGMRYGDKNTLSNTLSENIENKTSQTPTERVLFNRSIQAPWKLSITHENQTIVVKSSVTNSASMSIKTLDRKVQEDSRQVSWHAIGANQLVINSDFPSDLRALIETNYTLNVELNVDKKPTDAVSLFMGCGPSCTTGFDITEKLNRLATGQWETLSIDLRCFTNAGVDFGKVNEPLIINTAGHLSLSFSSIKYVPNPNASERVQCPKQVNRQP